MNRRGFLQGFGLALACPAVIRGPGLLMPVKALPAAPTSIVVEANLIPVGCGWAHARLIEFRGGVAFSAEGYLLNADQMYGEESQIVLADFIRSQFADAVTLRDVVSDTLNHVDRAPQEYGRVEGGA